MAYDFRAYLQAIRSTFTAEGYQVELKVSDPGWPAPNLILLNNALQQAGWDAEPLTGDNWRKIVGDRVQVIDWELVVTYVRPFLEPVADPGILQLENLMQVLE